MLKINEETTQFLLRKWAFLLQDTPEDKKVCVAWLLENQYNGVYSDNELPLIPTSSTENPIIKTIDVESVKNNKWTKKAKKC